MAVGAIALALAAVALEGPLQDFVGDELPWFLKSDPVGARSFLSTVAGSMITVAGVTFSMTVVAVAHASTQLGPRLLGNFMADRGNQVTLGTFIATFLYCVVVLRTVQAPEAPVDGRTDPIAGFIPHVALAGAAVMTMLSLVVLIYFIHHIPGLIRVSTITERVFGKLLYKIDEQYPATEEKSGDAEGVNALADMKPLAIVCSRRHGYVQYVDGRELVRIAHAQGWMIDVLVQPGAYICEGMELMRVMQASDTQAEDASSKNVDAKLAHCIGLGGERTATQDVCFLFEQLVEIAIRALSPGINDPMTAMRCLDRVQSALLQLAGRPLPARFRNDDNGALRLAFRPVSFSEVIDVTLVRYLPYAGSDRNARLHLMKVLEALASLVHEPSALASIEGVADRMIAYCERLNLGAYDSVELKRARKAIDEALFEKRSAVPPALLA